MKNIPIDKVKYNATLQIVSAALHKECVKRGIDINLLELHNMSIKMIDVLLSQGLLTNSRRSVCFVPDRIQYSDFMYKALVNFLVIGLFGDKNTEKTFLIHCRRAIAEELATYAKIPLSQVYDNEGETI